MARSGFALLWTKQTGWEAQMSATSRTFSVLAGAALIAATLVIPTDVARAGTCWNYSDMEERFAAKVNARRSQSDVARLKLDPELSKVARTHSRAMKRRGEPFHSSAETLTSRVTNWNVLAENVASGSTVKNVWRVMLDNSLHESHIVDARFVYMGVGVAVADGGTKYLTIVFEGRQNPGTTLPMPDC